MDFRKLECFFAVAEDLHFGRAAERLGIAQSSLSESIKAIERYIGGPLFHRTSRRVSLTPLGEALRDGGQAAFIALDATLRDCRALAFGKPRRLRFGFLGGGLYELHQPFVASLEAIRPTVEIEFVELSFENHFVGVQQGAVDVAFCRLPLGAPGLVHGPVLMADTRMLCVPEGHHLLGVAPLDAESLGGETLVSLVPGVTSQEWLDFHLPVHTPRGVPINRGREVRTLREAMTTVAAGQGLMILTKRAASYYATPGISFIEIDMPPICSALVWRREDRRPIVGKVDALLTDLARVHCPSAL